MHLQRAVEEAALRDVAEMDQLSRQFESLSLAEAASEQDHSISSEDL